MFCESQWARRNILLLVCLCFNKSPRNFIMAIYKLASTGGYGLNTILRNPVPAKGSKRSLCTKLFTSPINCVQNCAKIRQNRLARPPAHSCIQLHTTLNQGKQSWNSVVSSHHALWVDLEEILLMQLWWKNRSMAPLSLSRPKILQRCQSSAWFVICRLNSTYPQLIVQPKTGLIDEQVDNQFTKNVLRLSNSR